MEEKRQLEIALAIIGWRWKQLGTERFFGELKSVVEDVAIADSEMLEFIKIISMGSL
jgi:hypothetical protein